MIISRTPLRISFAGGGSDLSSYYRHHDGAVVSTTINKYIYITVNKKFDDRIRVSYSKTEFADNPRGLDHELVRESLLMLKIYKGIEITSISDIPSKGTGLGSSSSYTVGLLNALYAYKSKFASAERLGKEACKIEILRCKRPIGKQDQYAAAFGGLNYIEFNKNGTVCVNPIILKKRTKINLQENLLMMYTGSTRKAKDILSNQDKVTKRSKKKREVLDKMVSLAKGLKNSLEKNDLNDFGEILHENWILKKSLTGGISNDRIDYWYDRARKNGAIGGKILGAGGGGFLLLYAPRKIHRKIIRELSELKRMDFKFENEGSKIIYFGEK